jgi:GNAT superfamily N-acetyltransferase
MSGIFAIAVRKFQEAEFSSYRNLRLSALEESPDAFGSTLGAEQLRTTEEWASRLQGGCNSGLDLPLIGQVGTTAAGLAWGKVDRSDRTIVHLFQMWVAPEFRGRGIARLLLRTIVAWTASLEARSVHLGVASAESSAMRLYVSEGFVPFGQVEPLRSGSALLSQKMRFQIPNAVV